MKKILLLAGIMSLLASTGCIVVDGDRHGHVRRERHDDVIVGPAVVIVHPEVIVR